MRRSEPASAKDGNAELLACLTLVAPSGLTADDRRAWLAVARQTLSGIPADLLRDGCAEARRKCRFPSEIVPTILDAVQTRWDWRIEDAKWKPKHIALPASEPDTSPLVDPAEIAKLIKSIGNT